jgi:hypothetical protein
MGFILDPQWNLVISIRRSGWVYLLQHPTRRAILLRHSNLLDKFVLLHSEKAPRPADLSSTNIRCAAN